LYFDAKIGGVVVSNGQVTGHTYCQDRKKTTVSPESFRAKGVPDGSRGNEVYVQKARTGTVVSGCKWLPSLFLSEMVRRCKTSRGY
jgi:hypothetical protein